MVETVAADMSLETLVPSVMASCHGENTAIQTCLKCLKQKWQLQASSDNRICCRGSQGFLFESLGCEKGHRHAEMLVKDQGGNAHVSYYPGLIWIDLAVTASENTNFCMNFLQQKCCWVPPKLQSLLWTCGEP